MRLIPVLAWAGAAVAMAWGPLRGMSELAWVAAVYFVVQAVIAASAL